MQYLEDQPIFTILVQAIWLQFFKYSKFWKSNLVLFEQCHCINVWFNLQMALDWNVVECF